MINRSPISDKPSLNHSTTKVGERKCQAESLCGLFDVVGR